MTAELGNIALWTALVTALFGAAAAILGHRRQHAGLLDGAHNAVLVHWALVTIALLSLEYALVTSDFSIRYVAFNSSRSYPVWYKIGGLSRGRCYCGPGCRPRWRHRWSSCTGGSTGTSSPT